ncbi:4'-phosphopantetheinyl transferase superfamily protein [Paenibacillus sp. UMB4589-SE434]|uniref:4'-phosphopantetheinyl transferase family protein n=1 Tax=Paenibacillus sp. UMB4589-SE434 TaxID=3046314 RepID=UPI00254B090C|nr:4'-phosphopantetheinyl transferase superfamily protein [Paenibacillus sp. UMB4589-SE434]MDK8180617.1 4'-phosphopantetheinyl transferase superfamily protein [Paenibacillus sp. UMB4589-SE434]
MVAYSDQTAGIKQVNAECQHGKYLPVSGKKPIVWFIRVQPDRYELQQGEQANKWKSRLPLSEYCRVLSYRIHADRVRCLVGYLAVRLLTAKMTEIKPVDQPWSRTPYGKLSWGFNKAGQQQINLDSAEEEEDTLDPDDVKHSWHVNLSHSGDWIGVIGHIEPVGIDIEERGRISYDIAERWFHPAEAERIQQALDQQAALGDWWTLKESYVKWDGRGLSYGLNQFAILPQQQVHAVPLELQTRMDVEPFLWREAGCFKGDQLEQDERVKLQYGSIAANYSASICMSSNSPSPFVCMLTDEMLIEMWEEYMTQERGRL